MNTQGLRFDVRGRVEADLLGYHPHKIATTSNSYRFRLRLASRDVRKKRREFPPARIEGSSNRPYRDLASARHSLRYEGYRHQHRDGTTIR